VDCEAQLNLTVDVGDVWGDYGANGPAGDGPLKPQDVQVRFKLVRGTGSTQCATYGNNCDLRSGSSQGPTLSYSTQGTGQSPHLLLTSDSRENAVAIEIRLKNVSAVAGHSSTNANCVGAGPSFNANCRWYYTGSGMFGPSVAPTDTQILADPIQRSFRGDSVTASSVQWLRVTQDSDCDGGANLIDDDAASALRDGCAGFEMEMALKGGIPTDADEAPLIFTDGIASSKTGILHCDPYVSNGQSPIDSIANGCPFYASHSFDPVKFATSGLCPDKNVVLNPALTPPQLLPSPWDDWPPLQCVLTRSTSANQQMQTGLEQRMFGGASTCPAEKPDGSFTAGRNYWKASNTINPLNFANPDPDQVYGYQDNGPPARGTNFSDADPRLVTIFLVPTWAITNDGVEKTYPVAGFVQVYITGWGDLQNGGALRNGTLDPCPGNTPPPVFERDCQGSDCGFIAWGHVLNWVAAAGGATPSPTGDPCRPQADLTPCVAVLVQ